MGDEQKNKAILQEAYRLWDETKGGSTQHWLDIADDDICFGSLAAGEPRAEFTACRNNKEEMAQYLDGLVSDWSMVHYTIDDYIAEGDQVVAVGSTEWTNKRTGKSVDTKKVDVSRFENGKMVEFFEYYDTAKLFEAAT